MRFTVKGNRMATEEQKQAVKPSVEEGANVFADWEDYTKGGKKMAAELIGIYEAIRNAGIISPFECHAYSLETVALAAKHRAEVYGLHNRLVRRCVELGIDVPVATDPDIPQPADSGGHR